MSERLGIGGSRPQCLISGVQIPITRRCIITNRNVETYSKADFPLMIGNDPVSELKVMRSAAGYYIGRDYFDLEFGFVGPYSRESGYMNQADAGEALATMNFPVRDCVENNASYANDELPDIREEAELAQQEFAAWSQALDDEAEFEQEAWNEAEYRGCDYR